MSKEVLTHSDRYVRKTNRIILIVGIITLFVLLFGLLLLTTETPEEEKHYEVEDTIDENSIKSHCSSCGAVFSGKNLAISSVCSYCGAPLVLDYDAFGIDACIPFAFDRTTAKQKFKEGIKSKWFLPRKFKKETPENERIRSKMTDEIVEEIRLSFNRTLDKIKKERV